MSGGIIRREWYSAAELAELKLPAFPGTARNVQAMAVREGWAQRTNRAGEPLCRPRKGRGGGLEYHIALLPQSLRDLLLVKAAKVAPVPEPEPEPETDWSEEPPATPRVALRRDAILMVLSFWDLFLAEHAGTREICRWRFVTLFRNRKLERMPDWVYQALAGSARAGFCVNTLRNWERRRAEGEFHGLGGRYGNRKGTGVLDRAHDGAVAAFIAARIVAQPQLTADHLRDLVADRFGEVLDVVQASTGEVQQKPLPPLRTFQRWVSQWREDHAEALVKATDPDTFRDRRRVVGQNMNHWVQRPNQLWEIDASPADVMLKDGRHSVYVVVDIHTRRMLATVSKTATTAGVLLLLRKAILAWGVPEILRTDNGSDFTSHAFKTALAAIGIRQDVTAPFSPEQKGTVERHIGTLQRGLMPLLPGFIGHSVAQRKRIEARKAFSQRLGEAAEATFSVDLDAAELGRTIDAWLTDKYARKPHRGLGGRTPFEVHAAWPAPLRRIEDERALDILLAPIAGKDGIRTVTKRGIALDNTHFIAAGLVPGTRVLCRHDDADLGRLYVYDETGTRFIDIAVSPERLGIDPGEAVRAVRTAQAERIANELKPLQADIRRMGKRDAMDAVLRAAAARSGKLAEFPKPAKPHSTAALDAAGLAARAGEAPVPTARPTGERQKQAEIARDMAARKVVPLPETAGQRFGRARAIEARLAQGEAVAAEESRWLLRYVQTSEYRGHKQVFDNLEKERETR